MKKRDNCDQPPHSTKGDAPAGGDSKRVIIGNELKISFDHERDTTEKPWSRLGLPLPSDEPNISMTAQEQNNSAFAEKRADRGRRGVSKGNVLAYRNYGPDLMSHVDHEKVYLIQEAIAKLRLSEDASDSFVRYIMFYMAQMRVFKDFEHAPDNVNSLKDVLKAAQELIEALRSVNGHPALQASFDIAVTTELRQLLERG